MGENKQMKYFESQQPDEEVIFLVRRHILALAPVLSMAFFIYLIGFLLVFMLPVYLPSFVTGYASNVYILIVSLLFLFNTIFLFSNWVLHYLHVSLLTNEHFVEIDQYGLFGRKISALTLDKIQDVSNDQHGLVNTFFNLGFVQIQTAGEAPNFELHFVPNPSKICQTIMETEENYSSRHGLRGDSLGGNAAVHESVANAEAQRAEVANPVTPEPTIEYPGAEWNQEQK